MKLYPLIENPADLINTVIACVSAGEPIEIGTEIEELDLNYMLTRGSTDCYLIQVRGDSMSSEIQDGDWVMIDRAKAARSGDVVLADINGEFTLKRKMVDPRNGLYLVPANDDYPRREITNSDGLKIIGVVTHVIKKYK